jgi:environmental stress-induced protein Ves
MRIVRQSAFLSIPWKNGGGITHEALRVPAEGSDFRWRVSVAQIDSSGPFSDFADYERKLVLLKGAGVRLHTADGPTTTLREVGDLIEFDGAVPMQCELVAGPCIDLNLMVSKTLRGAQAWVQRLTEPFRADSSRHETLLVLPISGAMWAETANGSRSELTPWDIAVVSPGERGSFVPATEGLGPLVFFATLDDNSA